MLITGLDPLELLDSAGTAAATHPAQIEPNPPFQMCSDYLNCLKLFYDFNTHLCLTRTLIVLSYVSTNPLLKGIRVLSISLTSGILDACRLISVYKLPSHIRLALASQKCNPLRM